MQPPATKLVQWRSIGKIFLPIFLLVAFSFLVVTFLYTREDSYASANVITDGETLELVENLFDTSDSSTQSGIFLAENEPRLLNKIDAEEKLIQKFQETKESVVAFIDTGFIRKSDNQTPISDRISDIKIYFYIKNNSDQRERLTVNTGIKRGTLKNIRIEEATGYRWENDELVIAYIPLEAESASVVSLTAIPTVTHKPVEISVNPTLKNRNGEVVSQGDQILKTIQLDSQVDIENIYTTRKVNSL